jgi:hypothetical protein
MSLKLKKTKKNPNPQSTFKNIDTIHNEKLKHFTRLQEQLPKKLKTLATLKKKSKRNPNADTTKEITELENEIHKIETREEEVDYYLKTSSILKEYFELPSTSNNVSITPGLTLNNYSVSRTTELTMDYYQALDIQYPCNISSVLNQCIPSYCQTCNTEFKENDEKYLVCNNCGVIDNSGGRILDALSYKDIQESNHVSNFNYKRINYFTEWLIQLQGKENIKLDEDLLNKIKLELSKRRISDNSNLSHARMKKVLKDLHLNKYYEHIPLITHTICGTSPLNIPPSISEKMKKMFMLIQHPFELLKGNGRTNFFSYPYIFSKFCELLDLHHYLDHFSLLKTREKLINQDILWKKIVIYLNETTRDPIWRFIPSC